MTENWMPMPGWVGFYEISDLGRVRSIARAGRNGKQAGRKYGGGLVKPFRMSNGYLCVNLIAQGRRRQESIHRMVLRAFRGEPPPRFEGCHYDGNKTNNTLANLRWDTRKNNHADKIRHGTYQIGERASQTKLTEVQARLIKETRDATLADEMGIGRSQAYRIIHGEAWKHL